MNYRIIEGERRNSTLYIYNFYSYTLHHDLKNHISVRCKDWKKKNCKAVGKISKIEDVFEPAGFHLHPVDDTNVLEIKSEMKRKAERSTSTLREIFDEVSSSSNREIAAKVSYNDMESTMLKRRRKSEPPLPASAVESAYLLRDNPNLCDRYVDYVHDETGTAIIFIHQDQHDFLVDMTQQSLAIDGTFKVSPNHFKQLLCIHLLMTQEGRTHAFPIALCCLNNKSESLYRQVFIRLAVLIPALKPTSIMSDFERALRNAIIEVFPNVTLHGCWFHYTQAIMKNTRKHLPIAVRNEEHIKSWVMSVMSIPLLPATNIHGAFDYLLGVINDVRLDRLKNYIERQWKQRVTPEELSVFRLVNRTNNAAESFNRQLNKGRSTRHTNFFDFLRRVMTVFEKSFLELSRLHNGLQITRPINATQRKNELKLENAWNRFQENGNLPSFFTSIKKMNNKQYSTNGDSDDEVDDDEDDGDGTADTQDVDDDNENQPTCKVCLAPIADDDTRWVMVPCGHAPFCTPCNDVIMNVPRLTRNRVKRCPMCRAEVENSIRLFV